VLLLALQANPIEAYGALLQGAFGSWNSIADSAVKAVPLLFVALGTCIAFRGGVTNIGGEGQLIAGAIAGTALGLALKDWPALVAVPLALLAGFLAGGVWGGIAGVLKARFKVNEILSTIMLNSIAVYFMNFLLRGPMLDPAQFTSASRIPETARLPQAFLLARLVPTRLHLGALIAIVLAILVWVLLWRTTIGYRIRAVGHNPDAARYAGINVNRYIVLSLALSGALGGLGGAVQVFGVNFRMFTDGSAAGFTGSAGFNGIVAALFGQLHPLGAIPAAFFFGALLVGANKLQRIVQVPTALVTTLNGLVVVFVVSADLWRRQRARHREMEQLADVKDPLPLPVVPSPNYTKESP
jgi:simple sugar transport system permease protein